MQVPINAQCKKCKGSLVATIEAANHDRNLLDIVVHCLGKCKKSLNTFVNLDDMVELD